MKFARLRHWVRAIPILRGLVVDRDVCRLLCEKAPQGQGPIFIAVHGTWAQRAPWTRPDSRLFKELLARWPDAGLCRFEWSGVNGARHRLVASVEFAAQLDGLAAMHPASKLVVISHSHGGNVAAWGATIATHSLAAAVYLNTPFIQVLRSSPGPSVALLVVLWLAGGLIVFPPELMILEHFPEYVRDSLWSFAVVFGIGIAVLLLGVKHVPPRVQVLRESLQRFSTGARKISRELIVFVVGDEPGAALSAVYFSQWLMRRMSVVLIGGMLLLAIIGEALAGVVREAQIDQIGFWLAGIVLSLGFVSLMIAGSAYGLLHGLVALDSPVAVTPAPIGGADVLTVGWTAKDRLRHSLIHESPEVGRAIARWLESIIPPNGKSLC